MSRARTFSEKGNAQKEILPKPSKIFPSACAGGCGNTAFTVTVVEGYQVLRQICAVLFA